MITARYKTVIFDLDGTLVDTLTDIAEAANLVLDSLGFPSHPKDDYRTFVGDGLMTLAERILPEGSEPETLTRTAGLFRIHYLDHWDRNSRPFPGILSMLERLMERQINLAVLSNKPDDFTQLFVSRFFPTIAFGLVRGNTVDQPKKPDPKVALEMARTFATSPDSCLLVGDSAVDILTAKASGMASMGVTWGFREKRELESHGADLIVTQPEEIVSHVLYTR